MSDRHPATFSACGDATALLRPDCRLSNVGSITPIKLDEFHSSSHFRLSKNKQWIKVKATDHYVINIIIYITFECPIKTTEFVAISNHDSSYSLLNRTTIKNQSQANITVKTQLINGSALLFGLMHSDHGIKHLAISGDISLDSAWAQINSYVAYDLNVKVEYIIQRPSTEPYPYGYPMGPLLPPQFNNPSNPPHPWTPYLIPFGQGTRTVQFPLFYDINCMNGSQNFSSVYPWTSNVIPSKRVPDPIPPTLPNGDAYEKYKSIPSELGFYIDVDYLTLPANDPNVILFLTNWDNRGTDNYKKKVYMTALTTAVVPFYKEKIDNFLNQLVANFTLYNKPILSSFQTSLVELFLALHVGYDNYPDYVTNYFSRFIDLIGIGNPTNPIQSQYMIDANAIANKVKLYFQDRINSIIQNKDKTCFTYWWNIAGLPINSMVIEAVHNIFAFSQFNSISFLAIRDKLHGTPNLLNPSNPITYDFFRLINTASTESDKINVVREFMRILSPNPASFSLVQLMNPDPTNPVVQSRHAHQEIMMANTPGGPQNYYIYNTGQYTNFKTNFQVCPNTASHTKGVSKNSRSRCSFMSAGSNSVLDNFNPEDSFTVSSIDGETVLDAANPTMMPVYEFPQYMPFGLGYRRCAGEIFNYMIIIKILEKLSTIEFKFVDSPPSSTQITIGPFVQVPDNIYAITS